VLILLFVAVALSQQWTVVSNYATTSCTGTPSTLSATLGGANSCTASACSAGSGIAITCTNSTPGVPANMAGFFTYSSNNCGTGTETALTAYSSTCASLLGVTSVKATCNGANLIYSSYLTGTCTGSSVDVTVSGNCVAAGAASTRSTCAAAAASCFHKESNVELADGTAVTLASLGFNSPKCAVPHVHENILGVKIETACKGTKALRLTPDHLVYTQKGLVAAGTIRAGDYLYRDMAETQQCEVTATFKEFGTYYALNCEESTVRTEGFKTSTFGYNHAIPSTWMRLASKVFGVQRASAIGDSVANLLYKWNVISN
jgi:hypothetical protein